MNTAIPHPRVPLHAEQTKAMLECLTPDEVRAVRKKFNERRDAEFPGWRQEYDEAFDKWSLANGAMPR